MSPIAMVRPGMQAFLQNRKFADVSKPSRIVSFPGSKGTGGGRMSVQKGRIGFCLAVSILAGSGCGHSLAGCLPEGITLTTPLETGSSKTVAQELASLHAYCKGVPPIY